MILKHTKHFVVVLLLFINSSFSWAQDSIKVAKKAYRSIPENYKEQYTDKVYTYIEEDPGYLLQLQQWLLELYFSFLNTLGLLNRDLYYLKLAFYIIVIAVAIYIIAKMFFYKEGAWIFGKKRNENPLNYQSEVETIETANFEILIQNALKKQDYRLSVKFYYLWVLKKLSEKEIIELSNIKTNIDYQLEIDETSYSEKFKNVSYYYTYIWYGEFTIDTELHDKIASLYQQFLKEIS